MDIADSKEHGEVMVKMIIEPASQRCLALRQLHGWNDSFQARLEQYSQNAFVRWEH